MDLLRGVVALGLLIAHLVSCVTTATPGCPTQCSCSTVRSRPPLIQEQIKLRCGGDKKKVSSISEIQFSGVSQEISQLDLSDNDIGNIVQSTFKNLTSMQKLDLSQNRIDLIDKEAFKDLVHLKRLYLSSNKIESINKGTFKGLIKVERLKLNLNLITNIREGAFDELVSLKQLDISGNPLMCNCEILWILDWARNRSVKLLSPPKCESPAHLSGEPLRKLKLGSELQCTDRPKMPDSLELRPTKSQVVFEGDSLKLHCQAPVLGEVPLSWMWEDKIARATFTDVNIKDEYSAERGVIESWLRIDHLLNNHTGQWHCHLASEGWNQTRDISVIVISEQTQYCPHEVTLDSKGKYAWPKTVFGFSAELLCDGEPLGPRHAYRSCSRQGYWLNINASSCPYVSETTKILEQFSKMNLSLSKGTILESAKRLKNFTGDGKLIRDKMDVIFATRTIENYAKFLAGEKDLGALLIDTVGSLMHAPRAAVAAAEREENACTRLVRAVETTAEGTPSLQAHGPSLAVEEFRVRRDTFPGLACTWYSHGGGRIMHCSNSNASLEAKTKVIEASIQIPASIFHQLEVQGIPTVSVKQLTVTMFENGRLFPRLNETASLDVTSAVVGVRLIGVEAGNLTEPVYVILRAPSLLAAAGSPRPVWWDSRLNAGHGGWSHDGCKLSYFLDGLLVFQCNRLGYFALLQKTDVGFDQAGSLFGIKFRFSHPAIYIGSFIGVITLLTAIVSFILCHASIQMSKKTKHSLVNTWVALALLCFVFAAGINQTEDVSICQSIGLLLHYLTLSVLLWMSVTVSNMYKRLTKATTLHPPDDELPSDEPVAEKPLLGLYLVGWGIGLIVCGISGAVNVREYAGHTHCFLTPGPALSAVLVPAGMLVVYLTVFYLLIRCAVCNLDTNGQLSEGTQATENVDIDLLDSGVNNLVAERVSLHSVSTPTASSQIEDSEYSPLTQLKAHVIILILFLLMWTAAAFSTAKPFKDYFPIEEAFFSIAYAVLASCTGGFIVFFYCIVRSDVRGEWFLMRCWCRSKQGRCCRNRSISDTNPVISPVQPLTTNVVSVAGANVIASRHSVNNSISHHTEKTGSTNKSMNAAKAAMELNTGPARVEMCRDGRSNVNLVVLHRQQYRSNQSVTTYTEASGTSGAEMFYNPHQSTTARKFFRKQKRHLRQSNLGTRRCGDGGGGDTDSNRPKSIADGIPTSYRAGSSNMSANIRGDPCLAEIDSVSPNALLEHCEDNSSQCLPMERLVLGAEKEIDDLPHVNNSDDGAKSDHDEMKIEFEEGEAELASLAAEFKAIREEMRHSETAKDAVYMNVPNHSPAPSFSEEDFISTRTNSCALESSCSIENCGTSDRCSLTDVQSEVTIPETCSFISNSDSRMSSEEVDSDSVERFHNESLLSLNAMEGDMIDIGISSPEMSQVRFTRGIKPNTVIVNPGSQYRYSPVSGDAFIMDGKELACLPNGRKSSYPEITSKNISSENLCTVGDSNDNEQGSAINKKETSV